MRDRVLTAVDEVVRRQGWSAVTMAAVAAVAGVSRQTLYNEFGSRSDVAQAYVLREADRFVTAVGRAVTTNRDDPRAALSAAFDVFLTAAEEAPLIQAIASGSDGDELLALVTTHGGPVLDRASAQMASLLRESWPQVPVGDTELVSECVVRLAISYAALPTGPVDLTAASVGRLLGPFVERAFYPGAAESPGAT